eukprot:11247917-Heterocapsa_arctica.AAC.1
MMTKGMPTTKYTMLKQMIGLRLKEEMKNDEALITVIEQYEAPVCARCSGFHERWIDMQLQVNTDGQACWRCDSCQRILTWPEYIGTAPIPQGPSFRSMARSAAPG